MTTALDKKMWTCYNAHKLELVDSFLNSVRARLVEK